MLSNKYRITKNSDFDAIFQKGRHADNPLIYIKFLSNSLDYSRFGFIAGTKLFRKAVKRNRAKRLLREATRLNLGNIASGYDVLVGARSTRLYEMSCDEVENELIKLLQKCGLMKSQTWRWTIKIGKPVRRVEVYDIISIKINPCVSARHIRQMGVFKFVLQILSFLFSV